MINYSAFYESGKQAMIRKTVEASDSSIVDTGINFYNDEEKEFLTEEIIIEHMSNLLMQFKEVAAVSTIIPVGAQQTSYIIPEWAKLGDIFHEIVAWWTYVSYRPENDESDHYHDPITGEHVAAPTEEPASDA